MRPRVNRRIRPDRRGAGRIGLAARADERIKAYSLGDAPAPGDRPLSARRPELLILDEPMNGLDPAGIGELRELIGALVAEGRTVLLSSHLLDEVERTCDAAAIVDDGKVIAQGTIREVTGDGPRAIDIACDHRVRAASLLAAVRGIARTSDYDGGLRLQLRPEAPGDHEIVTELLRRLLAEAQRHHVGRARRPDGLQGSGDRHDARVHARHRSAAVQHRLPRRCPSGDPTIAWQGSATRPTRTRR
jgi:ABC-type multidrug transport system ATPase subunit